MQLIQINREKGAEDRRVCIFPKSSVAYSHAFNPYILKYPINAARIVIFNSQKKGNWGTGWNLYIKQVRDSQRDAAIPKCQPRFLQSSNSLRPSLIQSYISQLNAMFSHFHKTYNVPLTDAYNFSWWLETYAMFRRGGFAIPKPNNFHYLTNNLSTCSKADHISPIPGVEISWSLAALEKTINMSLHQYFQAYHHLLPCNLTSWWLKFSKDQINVWPSSYKWLREMLIIYLPSDRN